MVSLAFNVEAAVGSDSTLLRKLNAEDYEGAADEFKNWRKAGGVVAPGLVKRRAQETERGAGPRSRTSKLERRMEPKSFCFYLKW